MDPIEEQVAQALYYRGRRQYPTRYQQDLLQLPHLEGRQALDALNRSYPPDYGDEGIEQVLFPEETIPMY